MKNATRSLALGAAIALLPLGAAFAQTPPSSPDPNSSASDPSRSAPEQSAPTQPASRGATFESLDTNGDGKISKDEAEANPGVKAQFSKYDVNGDGFIERAEVNQANGGQSSPPQQ
jgi:hypothetical protein